MGQVNLYVDNAGNLFLYIEGSDTVYQDCPYLNKGSRFPQAAQAIINGDTRDWSEEWVHKYEDINGLLEHPETDCVAAWRNGGYVFIDEDTGSQSARLYLELSAI